MACNFVGDIIRTSFISLPYSSMKAGIMVSDQSTRASNKFARLLFALALALLVLGAQNLTPAKSSGAALLTTAPDLSADPDAEAIRCTKAGDTLCAVTVWENQFKLEPYDDQVRQSLVGALLVRCVRSLDTGSLVDARAALKRAKQLVPTSPAYPYLQDALDAYLSVIYIDGMDSKLDFTTADTSDYESRYVDIAGILGGQTSALALTEKTPGSLNYYTLSGYSVPKNVALRFEAYPTSANGTVYAIFGVQGPDDYYAATLDWSSGSSIAIGISHYSASSWTSVADSQYIAASPNQWHSVEVRIIGQTIQVFVDLQLVSQQIVFDYVPGKVGFGVGLNPYGAGTTFSAAFDDLVIYEIADSTS